MSMDKATLAQNMASEPAASTWLSANAGSGKTKVLTDRVARLLLSGVSPQNILCLTYTKAAASEMQNRLFRLLGEWAMKPDDQLRADLARLGEAPGADLGPTRSLFARAIETPGGLKIQTIHSFCAALLRRFPLEAGVSPQFSEMDERAAVLLREEVVEAMALDRRGEALAGLAAHYTGQDFGKLTEAIVSHRDAFAGPVDAAAIWRALGLAPGMDDEDIVAGALDPETDRLILALRPILQAGSPSEVKRAQELAGYSPEMDGIAKLECLQRTFLTKECQPLAKPLTKATAAGPAAGLVGGLMALMERLALAREMQNALLTARRTLALHRFARLFLAEYEARKQARGWLDFDDLIGKAGALLSDPALAAWVLYRLDGGIDHILVDEAQDTSPAQWRVIERLTQEFTSGESARDVARTIFVVGDPKQSIYSFQGAEPAAFARMKAHFAAGLAQVGQGLQDLRLEYSFRSSGAVLGLVDAALGGRPGLEEAGFRHIAFFDKPGRVDIWPVVEQANYKEERHWSDPADIEMPRTHISRLADAVAGEIGRMLAEETLPDGEGGRRRIEPRDILILVQRRTGGLFDSLIRACKGAGLPIAGADLLLLGGEIAVRDLTALLRFLATPEDDLSLAEVLRSPLCGLSEAALYDLAQPRAKGEYLWNALRDSGHAEVVAMLDDLRKAADFLRPYELIERALTVHRGRENLLARLGREAEDGIDALLAQALAHESAEIPSLTGFLEWLDAMEVKIKRKVDNAGNLIRVMTVHGAKGLEAPVVFLPDCAERRADNGSDLIEVGGEVIWKPVKPQMTPPVQAALAVQEQASAEEDARLLYVAATRAANWLIVAAAGKAGQGKPSWYDTLAGGLEALGAVRHDFALGAGWRHQVGDWQAAPGPDGGARAGAAPALPLWATTAPAAPDSPAAPLSPSDLGGAKVLPGEGDGLSGDAARQRGRQLHLLLEHLPGTPPETWPERAVALLSSGPDAADPDQARMLGKEVAALVSTPALAHVFAPDTLAEVSVSAPLPALGGQVIQGVIDRLIVSSEAVTVVDFKSNLLVPTRPEDIPTGILRQMAAYVEAVRQIFPDRVVNAAILWTTNAELMPIPQAQLAAAFSQP